MSHWEFNQTATEEFISRWQQGGGTERANYQLFLLELCALLELPKPDPASDDNRDNAYVFERRVIIKNPDGTQNNGFIDLYKRGSFVLEAKQSGLNTDSSGWDKAMLRAQNQADNYVRALPIDEGRPPFIVVTDVGRSLELYAEFSRSGATYTPFPDARSHRIALNDLRNPNIQQRLRQVWLNPLSLDPSRIAAKVTREIADQLAKLAKSLEAQGHAPQTVAEFMMRALFTMFAEDVGLLPENAFVQQLEELKNTPDIFVDMLESLWHTMNTGGFAPVLRSKILQFNGGLFADNKALPLNRDQIELLLKAAKADWTYVEPAIFGTLLERALDPKERHKLGAHYTPRAYVERLVFPTVIEPLRQEWQEVQAAALAYENQGKRKQTVAEVQQFHRHLCELRILDPACGSGNFLYVTLEHMKRLEGEVLNLLDDLGESQGLLEMEGITVDPHQFLGIEINPRAARIAEMVLWIGYLQWHYRTHGKVNPPEPVLRDFKNIENRDALLTYDTRELLTDEQGNAITRWDGITTKTSPITGEQIPDESAQVEQYIYRNPQKAQWPQADYIVGNPPFIGNKRMRTALGDGYVDALRSTWGNLPESIDFVMHWWHIAAEQTQTGSTKQFGFITTNSIKQTFNQRIIQPFLNAKKPISIIFAIPDHPWVDAADGAAVRIAMTASAEGNKTGRLSLVKSEQANNSDEVEIQLTHQIGKIFADLRVGADFSQLVPLKSNSKISNRGVIPHGEGMTLSEEQAQELGLGKIPELATRLRKYRNGRDIAQTPRHVRVIDMYGLSAEQVRDQYPTIYQWLLERVKPERDLQKDKDLREKWWLHRRNNDDLRRSVAEIDKYIATVQTSKHRVFTYLDSEILPDDKLIAIAVVDDNYLGILSSRVHIAWALATGATLEDRPVYNKNTCFETFPFPNASAEQQEKIRDLAERLDAHRKHQQAQHPDLTLTNMYNVLEKLRSGEPLTAKEKTTHEQGLISVLRELHDELDRAVFAAYGWQDLAEKLVGLPGATTPLPDKSEAQAQAEEELLQRLVDLNAERALEEAQGKIRWLRPDYQNPQHDNANEQNADHSPTLQGELDTDTEDVSDESADESTEANNAAKPEAKTTWPKTMREQIAAVRALLQTAPQSSAQIASQFKRTPTEAVQAVLDALEELGIVQQQDSRYGLRA